MKTILVALLFALVGCASPAVYSFDGQWSDAQKTAVMAGVAEWHDGKSTVFVAEFGSPTAPNDPRCLAETANALGWTANGATCFYMSAGDLDLQKIAAHEAGHRLGLYHSVSTDPPSVMRANLADDTETPTAWDQGNVSR